MHIWRPLSLSELTPIIFYMELTYLNSETSKKIKKSKLNTLHIFRFRLIIFAEFLFRRCYFISIFYSP